MALSQNDEVENAYKFGVFAPQWRQNKPIQTTFDM